MSEVQPYYGPYSRLDNPAIAQDIDNQLILKKYDIPIINRDENLPLALEDYYRELDIQPEEILPYDGNYESVNPYEWVKQNPWRDPVQGELEDAVLENWYPFIVPTFPIFEGLDYLSEPPELLYYPLRGDKEMRCLVWKGIQLKCWLVDDPIDEEDDEDEDDDDDDNNNPFDPPFNLPPPFEFEPPFNYSSCPLIQWEPDDRTTIEKINDTGLNLPLSYLQIHQRSFKSQGATRLRYRGEDVGLYSYDQARPPFRSGWAFLSSTNTNSYQYQVTPLDFYAGDYFECETITYFTSHNGGSTFHWENWMFLKRQSGIIKAKFIIGKGSYLASGEPLWTDGDDDSSTFYGMDVDEISGIQNAQYWVYTLTYRYPSNSIDEGLDPPPPPPDCEEECMGCCDEIKELLVQIKDTVGVEEFPALVPEAMTNEESNEKEINNIPGLIAYLHETIDELVGQFPIKIKVRNSDLEDNEPQEIILPNISETLTEIFNSGYLAANDTSENQHILLRLVSELAQVKIATIKAHDIALTTSNYLAFPVEQRHVRVKSAFNWDENEKLGEFLKQGEISLETYKSKQTESLQDVLQELLFAAGLIKAVFYRENDSSDYLGTILRDFMGVEKKEQEKSDETWETFKGLIENPVPIAKTSPWTRRIEDL